jgi:hypothetical protein
MADVIAVWSRYPAEGGRCGGCVEA